jgi:hypothetical protein
MQCLYCRTILDPLRVMEGGSFCSDDHALMHAVDTHTSESLYLFPDPEPAVGTQLSLELPVPHEQSFPVAACGIPTIPLAFESQLSSSLADLLPTSLLPEIKDSVAAPISPEPKIQSQTPQLPLPWLRPVTTTLQPLLKRHLGLVGRFKATPIYWKLLASLVPILLAASFDPFTSTTVAKAKDVGQLPMVSGPIQQVKDSIRQRAAVILTDDFRSGLDAWESRSNLANAWAYDPNGFVRPGTLAVYRPSMGMTDYTVEFLTQVEQRALGAAFRVEDWTHYYAVKLVVSRNGPVPSIEAVHYTVINGKETNKVVRPLNIPMRNTSLYRIRLDVHGNDFTLISQGKIVDYWSDGRYSKGGVGFFCGKGERARVRWVEVSHQYDLLGRFCAFLSPDDGSGSKSGLE